MNAATFLPYLPVKIPTTWLKVIKFLLLVYYRSSILLGKRTKNCSIDVKFLPRFTAPLYQT